MLTFKYTNLINSDTFSASHYTMTLSNVTKYLSL